MTEPPAGPLAARFEMMMAELLARQAAALAGSDAPERPPSPATLPQQPTANLPAELQDGLTGRTATAPRPVDLGLPRAVPLPGASQNLAFAAAVSVESTPGADVPDASSESRSAPTERRPIEDASVRAREPGIGSPGRDPLAGPRARLILELGRMGTDIDQKAALQDASSASSAGPMRDRATTDMPGSVPVRPADDEAATPPRAREKNGPASSEASGPEPETSIATGRAAAELGRVRPSGQPALPQIDPAGLALDLALMVNAEMHKGWPAARFVPFLEKPRPPLEALEWDEDEPSEDEDAGGGEGEERSAGFEAMLAYIGGHAASRRLKRTLLFALGCYCALLNTLTSEILEYFVDEVDEGIEENHDRV